MEIAILLSVAQEKLYKNVFFLRGTFGSLWCAWQALQFKCHVDVYNNNISLTAPLAFYPQIGLISGFHCKVEENYALLDYYAVNSGSMSQNISKK
jgi:hypothetical protein